MALTVSGMCGLWRSELEQGAGAGAGAGGCRLQQSGVSLAGKVWQVWLVDRQTDRQMDRQASRWYAFQDGNAAAFKK